MSLREILKQPNIDSVGGLLVKTLMGPKLKKANRSNTYKLHNLSTRIFNVGAKVCVQSDKEET